MGRAASFAIGIGSDAATWRNSRRSGMPSHSDGGRRDGSWGVQRRSPSASEAMPREAFPISPHPVHPATGSRRRRRSHSKMTRIRSRRSNHQRSQTGISSFQSTEMVFEPTRSSTWAMLVSSSNSPPVSAASSRIKSGRAATATCSLALAFTLTPTRVWELAPSSLRWVAVKTSFPSVVAV